MHILRVEKKIDKITEAKEYSREEVQSINIDEIFPDKKDYERANGLKWQGSTFHGDNSPFVSEASKMAKLIKDPYKLVRRALAVADRWYWGYYDGRKDDIFIPFRNRLIDFGFTGKQINDIKEKAWKLNHDHYKDKFKE